MDSSRISLVRDGRAELSPGQAGEVAHLPLKRNTLLQTFTFSVNSYICFTGCKAGPLLRISRKQCAWMCTGRTSAARADRALLRRACAALRALGRLRPALSPRHPPRAPHLAHGPLDLTSGRGLLPTGTLESLLT